MFCPKCGSEAQEGQRFCKSCGANLQIVSDALGRGEDTLGQLRVDLDSLQKKAVVFATRVKEGVMGEVPLYGDHSHKTTRSLRERRREEQRQREQTRPKEWLPYSWQHSLKSGLISLFGGVGFGVVVYILTQITIEEGTIRSLENLPYVNNIAGLERLVSMLWLVALVPVLKGVAQIIYAAFFAESIATLSERFVPKPVTQQEPEPSGFHALGEPPTSVTEHTTEIFEPSEPRVHRESQ
jgi:zinc ribbon protein